MKIITRRDSMTTRSSMFHGTPQGHMPNGLEGDYQPRLNGNLRPEVRSISSGVWEKLSTSMTISSPTSMILSAFQSHLCLPTATGFMKCPVACGNGSKIHTKSTRTRGLPPRIRFTALARGGRCVEGRIRSTIQTTRVAQYEGVMIR